MAIMPHDFLPTILSGRVLVIIMDLQVIMLENDWTKSEVFVDNDR